MNRWRCTKGVWFFLRLAFKKSYQLWVNLMIKMVSGTLNRPTKVTFSSESQFSVFISRTVIDSLDLFFVWWSGRKTYGSKFRDSVSDNSWPTYDVIKFEDQFSGDFWPKSAKLMLKDVLFLGYTRGNRHRWSRWWWLFHSKMPRRDHMRSSG